MFPIKTVTKLDERALMDCNNIVIGRRQRIMVPIIAVLTLIFIVSVVLIKVNGGRVEPYYWVLGALFVVYLLFYTVFLKLLVRRNVRKMLERTGDRVMTCEFYEDKLEVLTEGEKVNGSNTYEYSLLTSVYETDDAFYPSVSRSMMPVSKQGLSPEQVTALREALKKYVPEKKYRRINK